MEEHATKRLFDSEASREDSGLDLSMGSVDEFAQASPDEGFG